MQLTDQQAQAINDAGLQLFETAINTVGVSATVQLLDSLKTIIVEEPKFARKLADPATQERLTALSAKLRKVKKPGLTDLMGMLPELKEIFA